MVQYKSNPYNILIPVEEREEFLLFNTLTGGIEVLEFEEGILVAELLSLKSFVKPNEEQNVQFCHLFDYLVEKEYILNEDQPIVGILEKHISDKQYKNAETIHLTIGTTITCNMGCSYCFEFIKPNHTLKDERVKKQTVTYIEQIINNSGHPIRKLSVTWYGGEPLINVRAIEDMSVGLIQLASDYNLEYEATIITNGIYLTPENTSKLVSCKVGSAQVTIDGAREVHDRKRPLKQKQAENYFRILRNLAQVPKEIQIAIRMNVDHEVANTAEQLLDDLASYEIWPQRYDQFKLTPAWLRSYEEIEMTEDEKDRRMTIDEYFDFKQRFRLLQLEKFNEWSATNGGKKALLKWDLPEYQSACPTWASPVSLVVDPNGKIHKCWETIHDESQAPASVFDDYDPAQFSYYTSFNRFNHHVVCRNCKFLPVCDKISCSFEAIKHAVPQCTAWKYKAQSYIKAQYLRMKEHPETINTPQTVDGINTGHSNK